MRIMSSVSLFDDWDWWLDSLDFEERLGGIDRLSCPTVGPEVLDIIIKVNDDCILFAFKRTYYPAYTLEGTRWTLAAAPKDKGI
jgi:hypothetical protein